jgi:polar amino acid transport system permease protein
MFNILRDYGLLMLIGQYPHGPIGGLAMTLLMAAAGLTMSFPLAIGVGIARTSPLRVFQQPAAALVYTVRGLPVLLVIFWAYFIVPVVIGKAVSGVTTVIWALVIYESAYLGEVVHAGIAAIPKGQVEAARSLGLSYVKTLRSVVLPQALFNMIPSILNEFIVLVKNTSLAYVIGVNELTYAAYQVNSQLLTKPFQVYFILAMTYFGICFSLSRLVGWAERRIKAGREVKRERGFDHD